MNVEDNCSVYEGKDAFLQLPTRFGNSVRLRGAVICVLDSKQNELGTGRGSYAVILLVSLLGSPMIAKFNGMGVHCFAVALFSALYVYYFRISCPYTIACGQSM